MPMRLSGRLPALNTSRRARSCAAARLGQSWQRTPLRLDTFEDRAVPSASAMTNEWEMSSPNAPLVFSGSTRRELVIVDPRVTNYQSIVRDLVANQSAWRQFEIAIL